MKAEKPVTIVIFGASGDLTRRKLIPALCNSYRKGRLPARLNIVGFARRPYGDEEFRERLREGVHTFAGDTFQQGRWEAFERNLAYFQGDLTSAEDFLRLKSRLAEIETGPADRLYYMATAPRYFVPIVENLGVAGMASEEEGWRRIVVEKPFGRDLASARQLNWAIHSVFRERQVYRIDHYLGKETAQNILFFRFANTIFEPVWSRAHVSSVQVTVAESVGVGHRAGYYDKAGVLRDMFQNHMLQLLSLVAMEPPATFDADAVRNEKVKLLRSIRPIALPDTVRAQYRGYRDTEGIEPGSNTPTYAALKLYVDNWRWKGVPFYMRSGKMLAGKRTEIVIEFQRPPHLIFDFVDDKTYVPNILSLFIQPDEGMHLKFEAKVPDSPREMRPVDMEFHYQSSFKGSVLPDAYERLLLNVIEGDPFLFTRNDGIEASWELVDPVIEGWEKSKDAPPLVYYDQGSWGPGESDDLLSRKGHEWIFGCMEGVPGEGGVC